VNLYGDLPIYLFVMPVDVYGYIYINGDYIMDKKDNYNKDNELDADKIINSVAKINFLTKLKYLMKLR